MTRGDWESLYLDILEFKEERGFHNLLVRREHPRAILTAKDPKLYGLICDHSFLNPQRVDQAEQLQIVLANVLKKYVESFYRKRQQRWDSERMQYKPITKNDDNFQDYVVKVPRSDPDLIKAVKEIIDEGTVKTVEVVTRVRPTPLKRGVNRMWRSDRKRVRFFEGWSLNVRQPVRIL